LLRTDAIIECVRGPDVLDVGCTGHELGIDEQYWLHGQLRRAFPRVVGIDISEDNVARLRARGLSELHVQSAEEFDLSERFDTVVAGELIEHLANPGCFLDRAREHLKKDGRLVLSTPYPFSLLYMLYAFHKYPRTCQNPQHTCWFCPRTLTALAERHGFRVRQFELIEDYYPYSPSAPYRTFIRLIRLFGRLLPDRLSKNTMLFVLEPAVVAVDS
jgi:2-polyprenyl-3-methyl-5-hydroxy-6-metoxy-1,4-benzoquinol methylase